MFVKLFQGQVKLFLYPCHYFNVKSVGLAGSGKLMGSRQHNTEAGREITFWHMLCVSNLHWNEWTPS